MATMRTKVIQTTKWGTACAPCASAKAKCSRQSESQPACDRCERLLKQCTGQVHRPRKPRQPRQSPLGSKDSPSEAYTHTIAGTRSPSTSDLGRSSASSLGDPISAPPSPQGLTPTFTPASNHGSNAPSCSCRLRAPFSHGPLASDNDMLDIFRSDLMPHHPFVTIPRHMRAEELHKARPFLMATIRIITAVKTARLAHDQLRHILSHLACRIVSQAERSTDLLMGVTVILGWYHHWSLRHTQLSSLLCLAGTLAVDLGLWKRGPGRSNQDKRLALGVWYLRSSTAVHSQLLDAIPWTRTLSQYATELKRENEFPSDHLLVELVSIQRVTERIVALQGEDEAEPQGQTMSQLQAQLDGMRPLASSSVTTMHIATALLRINESNSRHGPQSVKAWFESWLSDVPSALYHVLPTTVTFQLLYAVVIMFRWVEPTVQSTRIPISRSTLPTMTAPANAQISDAITALQEQLAETGILSSDIISHVSALGERRGREYGLLLAAQRSWPSASDSLLSILSELLDATMRGPCTRASSTTSPSIPHDDVMYHESRTAPTPGTYDYSYPASSIAEMPIPSIEEGLPSLHLSGAKLHPALNVPLTRQDELHLQQWESWDPHSIWASQPNPCVIVMEGLDPDTWYPGQQHTQEQGRGKEWENEVDMNFDSIDGDFSGGYGRH